MIGGVVVLVLAILDIPARHTAASAWQHFCTRRAIAKAAATRHARCLISVGSGGIFGKGLGYSVQAYGYTPEASNDSIFAIMAEEFGFVGTVIILLSTRHL
jgi:cell division protein FtsW